MMNGDNTPATWPPKLTMLEALPMIAGGIICINIPQKIANAININSADTHWKTIAA